MFLLFFSEQKINEEEISALSSGHFYPLGFWQQGVQVVVFTAQKKPHKYMTYEK